MFDLASSTSPDLAPWFEPLVVDGGRRPRAYALGALLADHIVVEHIAIAWGVGTPPSFLPTRRALGLLADDIVAELDALITDEARSGPAMSLRTSCCDLPQNEQYSVLLSPIPVSFVIHCLSWPGLDCTAFRPNDAGCRSS